VSFGFDRLAINGYIECKKYTAEYIGDIGDNWGLSE
jgi:hypothetical protein